jgi:hypothetical protein
VRQHLRGWAKILVVQKREKKELLDKLDMLDKKVEAGLLFVQEADLKQCLHNRLNQMLREEELKWYQRSKAKHLLEGDSNTKYFHLLANGRHRTSRIFQLQDGGRRISLDEELKKYITSYYKGMFGPPSDNFVRMDDSSRDDIPQVSEEENRILVEEFSEEEVKKALFQMEHNKSPGPNGFLVEFYQVFWEVIKADLMALFHEFHRGKLPLYNLNFGTIILLSKCEEAVRIQQYRPICLLNVSFKIFTKVLTNRLALVAQKAIQPTQTAFILGWNIMEGVVVLHETNHELHRKKQNGVIFKIGFKKAYDKVK